MRPLIMLLLLAGCVNTQATLLDQTLHPAPICPEAVKLYLDSSRVGAPYTEVAFLTSSGDNNFTSENGMYNSQRQKAASLGANGIIMGQVKEASTGAQIASAIFGTPANRKGKAVAIYVPSDTARVRQACAGKNAHVWVQKENGSWGWSDQP